MNTAKYLQRSTLYPIEPVSAALREKSHFAVIPVYDELDHIALTLKSVKAAMKLSPEPVKVILVINEPFDAPAEARQHNRELLASLRNNDGKYDGGLSVGCNLFYINLTDKEISYKFRNVGNARKAGFDGAIQASDGKVTDDSPLLFSLDADTLIAVDYFEKALFWAESHPKDAGAVFHFAHRFESGDPAVNQAAMQYEIYLRDYAWKIKQTTSPYAFWTIGSAFMCRMASYIACGGMRRNAAGEDFYFLQALAKVGKVGIVPRTAVYPSGRVSARVPFGTGPAIAKAVGGQAVLLYNQKCFDILKDFFAGCAQAEYSVLADNIKIFANEYLIMFFDTLGFSDIWAKIVKNTPRRHDALLKALHTSCDGFFIMKFCHFLEEKYPLEFARQPITVEGDAMEYLQKLRQLDCDRFI